MSGLTEVDILTIVIFFGALVATGSIFAVLGGDPSKAKIDQRLARIGPRSWERAAAEYAANIRKRDQNGKPLDKWLSNRLPRREELVLRLERTGHRITLSAYVMASILVAAAIGAAAWLFGMPGYVAGGVGALGGVVLPRMVISFLIARRVKKFLRQFPEAIDQIVRGVRSGLPVGESMAAIAADMEVPVADEFRSILDGLKVGRTFEESLWTTGRRLDISEFNFLVISMVVQRETGGNLAETLANLSDIIRKRQQMRSKARAMASEARASALIVGSLPFIMGALLLMMNPEYVAKLYTDPRGMMLLGLALASEVTGFLVMMKMAKFDI